MFEDQQTRDRLKRSILAGEDWLINRILGYAKQQGYAQYTSTLEEAWRISIHELSATVIKALDLDHDQKVTEFWPDEEFTSDPISAFAVIEADRHRTRGIELKMFLGLFKYYRQVYLERVEDVGLSQETADGARYFITRLFDRLEIAFCSAWAEYGTESRFQELQDTNRRMTNEKNRFLTVTESLGSPVIHLDRQGQVTYANQAAAPILGFAAGSGAFYYHREKVSTVVPDWLRELASRARQTRGEITAEHIEKGDIGEKIYDVHLHPMLDVSDKFQGTVAILHDITALRRAEIKLQEKARLLEQLSHTDPLTGLYNRRGLLAIAEKHMEMARRSKRPLSVLYGDVDNLKTINDKFGHATGDIALVAFANALQRSFRATDTAARVGGDEFVVVLPDRADPFDELLLRRTCRAITEELDLLGVDVTMSISVGSARYDPDRHSNFDQLLAEADAAMYLEKRRKQTESHTSKPEMLPHRRLRQRQIV